MQYFHAGYHARRQEGQHRAPVVRWAETETKEVLVLLRSFGLPGEAPDLTWRSMIGFLDRGIEASYASETRSRGDLIHWQAGLVDQLLRKM